MGMYGGHLFALLWILFQIMSEISPFFQVWVPVMV